MAILTLAAAWVAWCVVHSLLIAPGVRAWFARRLGRHDRNFRLGYNLVAVVTLLPVLAYDRTVHGAILWRWDGPWLVVRVAALLAAAWLLRAGARKYDLGQFLGLAQRRTGARHATLSASGGLDTSGVLGITRHPWYLAGLLVVWADARVVDTPGLAVDAVLSPTSWWGRLEERKLVREFGDPYRRYQREVSMLIPWRWVRRRLT
ncbi:MAG: NnrU family protein [Candidatus Krumholzibacteriia bacterium]